MDIARMHNELIEPGARFAPRDVLGSKDPIRRYQTLAVTIGSFDTYSDVNLVSTSQLLHHVYSRGHLELR